MLPHSLKKFEETEGIVFLEILGSTEPYRFWSELCHYSTVRTRYPFTIFYIRQGGYVFIGVS